MCNILFLDTVYTNYILFVDTVCSSNLCNRGRTAHTQGKACAQARPGRRGTHSQILPLAKTRVIYYLKQSIILTMGYITEEDKEK